MKQQPAAGWTVFPTELGWMAFTGSAAGVQRLTFGHPDRTAVLAAITASLRREVGHMSGEQPSPLSHAQQELLQERLCQYTSGEPVEFADLPVDLQHCTPFQRSVLQALRLVSFGVVQTYSQLATAAGFPGAARAVGTVMARNRIPLILPCHRILREGGQLGGYSAPQGLSMKRLLLQLEGAAHSPTRRSSLECIAT